MDTMLDQRCPTLLPFATCGDSSCTFNDKHTLFISIFNKSGDRKASVATFALILATKK